MLCKRVQDRTRSNYAECSRHYEMIASLQTPFGLLCGRFAKRPYFVQFVDNKGRLEPSAWKALQSVAMVTGDEVLGYAWQG